MSTAASAPSSSTPLHLEPGKHAECLVSFGHSKKVVRFSGAQKLADLREGLRKSDFAHLLKDRLLIQMHNERFNCFVDLDDDTTVPDGALINVITLTSPDETAEHPTATGRDSSPPRSGTCGSSASGMDSSGSGARGVLLQRNEYMLPKMPLNITACLSRVKEGDVPDDLRKRIIDWIFYGISSGTLYPRNYSCIAASLVAVHPELRDSSDTGYFSWTMSIKNKFKNIRKRMPEGNSQVDSQKEKVKMRKQGGSAAGASKTAFHRETAVKAFELDPLFVDETVNFMKKELKKPAPDMAKVSDAMKRTAAARRKSVESMNLAEFLGTYPALTLKEQILSECCLLTGIQADSALRGMLQEFGDAIFNAAEGKRAALATLALARARMDAVEGFAKTCAREVGALALLPFLLKERGDEVFRALDPDKLFGNPTLLFTGEDPWTSGSLCVVCEDVQIDVLDFAAGISVVFGMYWAYNIQYVASARHTLSVLERLMGINSTKLSVRAVKVLTALKARS